MVVKNNHPRRGSDFEIAVVVVPVGGGGGEQQNRRCFVCCWPWTLRVGWPTTRTSKRPSNGIVMGHAGDLPTI